MISGCFPASFMVTELNIFWRDVENQRRHVKIQPIGGLQKCTLPEKGRSDRHRTNYKCFGSYSFIHIQWIFSQRSLNKLHCGVRPAPTLEEPGVQTHPSCKLQIPSTACLGPVNHYIMHILHILHVSHTLLMKSLNLWTSSGPVTHCGMSAETGPVLF